MAETRLIRVVIVDDHNMVRSGLAVFLKTLDDLELVGEAGDGAEAVRLCAELQPDVVLMDLVMPGMDGITAIRAIRQTHPNIRIVALTSFTDQELVQGALQAGAIGYLLKNASIDELAEAIRAAHAGKPTLAPEAFQSLMAATAQKSEQTYDLSDREREVLALMVEGLINSEIAERLVLGRSTVKTHISNILSKLGAANRTEATALALEHNLVSRPRPGPAN